MRVDARAIVLINNNLLSVGRHSSSSSSPSVTIFSSILFIYKLIVKYMNISYPIYPCKPGARLMSSEFILLFCFYVFRRRRQTIEICMLLLGEWRMCASSGGKIRKHRVHKHTHAHTARTHCINFRKTPSDLNFSARRRESSASLSNVHLALANARAAPIGLCAFLSPMKCASANGHAAPTQHCCFSTWMREPRAREVHLKWKH